MKGQTAKIVLGLLVLVCGGRACPGAEPDGAPPATGPVVVLDTTGVWRMHHTLKPPVIRMDDGPQPFRMPMQWLNDETAEPPADWAQPDFDDRQWLRGPSRLSIKSPYLTRLCMRGKFQVTDPAEVGDLRLSLAYQGGVVIYLNGRELTRAHLPAGDPVATGSAEAYPVEAFTTPKGALLPARDWREKAPDPELLARYAMRERTLSDVAVPGNLLRKGVNVLAIEIVGAAYPKVIEELKAPQDKYHYAGTRYDFCFNTCEFSRVQLTAASTAGLRPNAVRPPGLQVWNNNLLASDYDLDFGDPCEPLGPIRIVGTRNGAFSGKAVVGSDRPIRGLSATAGPLTCGDAAIPASAVKVRYGIPWGEEWGVWGLSYGLTDIKHWRYPRRANLLGALAEAPLEEFLLSTKQPDRFDLKTPGQPDPVFGAVAPVWVTVTVPADARPGRYAGPVTIRAEGEQAVTATVELDVAGWKLPDTQDWRTWVELVQSPDTSSVEYGLDLWSERHWQMIAHSLELIGRTGSRVVFVPLIAQTNHGNEQSMVRWIDKGAGRFDWDFSIMDRYLDTAEKSMGKPKMVVFVIWEVYMMDPQKSRKQSSHDQEGRTLRFLQGKLIELGSGPVVTMVDPATGKCANAELPRLDDPASKAVWAPLFAALRERLKPRGLEQAMVLGEMSDAWPTREEALLLKEVSGDLPWVSYSHMGVDSYRLHDVADVAYQAHHSVNSWSAMDNQKRSRYGWNRPEFRAQYNRTPGLDAYPLARWRHFGEVNIMGRQRGIGRIGADFWRTVRDRRGIRAGTVADRYPQSTRRNLNIYTAILAPGPDGPVATTRFEAFREGIQECEARIAIEHALIDEGRRAKLGPELAGRCQNLLDERWTCVYKGSCTLQLSGPYFTHASAWWYFPVVDGNTWYIGSGWEERSRQLYTLAGEVARKLDEK